MKGKLKGEQRGRCGFGYGDSTLPRGKGSALCGQSGEGLRLSLKLFLCLQRHCVSLPHLSISHGALFLGHVIFWVDKGREMQPSYFPLTPPGDHKFPYLLVGRGLCCPVLYQPTNKGSISALRRQCLLPPTPSWLWQPVWKHTKAEKEWLLHYLTTFRLSFFKA